MPLGALRAFDTVARLGGAKAAANRLGVTATAVSHQLRTLEEHLGAQLFERRHRELRLTRAGAQLAAATAVAFDGLSETLQAMTAAGLLAGRSTLTVSAAPTFATKWLAPRIHLFTEAHPSLELRLRAEETLTDPGSDRSVDVAIRYGAGPFAPALDATRLVQDGSIICVVAPETAAGLCRPADLLHLPLLRTASPRRPSGAGTIDWPTWLRQAGLEGEEVREAVSRAPLFGTTQLALETAMAGRGAALAPHLLVADDLRSGRLVEPFGVRLLDPFNFWLLARSDRSEEWRVSAFRRWLSDLLVRAPP